MATVRNIVSFTADLIVSVKITLPIIITVITINTYQDNTVWIKLRSYDHTSSSPTISALGQNLLTNLYPETPNLQSKTSLHVKATLFRLSQRPHALSLQITVSATETSVLGIKNLHFTNRAYVLFDFQNFLPYSDFFLPTHLRCKGLLLQFLTTMTHTHTHFIAFLWTRNRPVTEIST
jgi:hypothetical protein